MSSENHELIFLKPIKFEECIKCARYIKDSKIIILNLLALNENDARRMFDYVSGAVSITNYNLESIEKGIYCVFPNYISYKIDESVKNLRTKNSNISNQDNEEEEIIL